MLSTGFLAEACEDLFYQMIRRLAAMGEITKETVFIDGTKLEACIKRANGEYADQKIFVIEV